MYKGAHNKIEIAGVVLAGGQSRRMGEEDKCRRPLAGKPMIAHAIDRLRPQVSGVIINANCGETDYDELFSLPVVRDVCGEHIGPLAGVLTGMQWASRHMPHARWIATAACDTPFLPENYVETLRNAAGEAAQTIAIASSGGHNHYVLGLWPVGLAADLTAYLEGGDRKVQLWVERHPHVIVAFPLTGGIDPFFNANTPEDFITAERMLRGRAA